MAGGKENLLLFLESLLAEKKYKEASVIIDAISAVEPDFYRDLKNLISVSRFKKFWTIFQFL